MRAIVHACLLSLVIVSAGTENSVASPPVATASARSDTTHARVVVTFANEPRQSPGPAGSTGRRYTGDGYLLAQSAHRQAKRVAAKYALREVANWPIKALAIHCVVYEIPDGRPVSDVVAALTSDSQIVFAQPLQQFGTQARR